jgi:hypothetical protein
VSHEQHTGGRRRAAHRVERLRRVESTRQRLMQGQALALGLAPPLRRQLGRLPGAHSWAVEHQVEGGTHACQRGPRRARLLAPTLGQAALGVRAGAVRLGLSVPE